MDCSPSEKDSPVYCIRTLGEVKPQGRRGIRFMQHLYDLRLHLRKGAVYSSTTTALFRTAPSVYLGAAIVAALTIPVGGRP